MKNWLSWICEYSNFQRVIKLNQNVKTKWNIVHDFSWAIMQPCYAYGCLLLLLLLSLLFFFYQSLIQLTREQNNKSSGNMCRKVLLWIWIWRQIGLLNVCNCCDYNFARTFCFECDCNILTTNKHLNIPVTVFVHLLSGTIIVFDEWKAHACNI